MDSGKLKEPRDAARLPFLPWCRGYRAVQRPCRVLSSNGKMVLKRRVDLAVLVEDAHCSADIMSPDCRREHPLLPRYDAKNDWSQHRAQVDARKRYLLARDSYAFTQIEHEYPKLKPAGFRPLTQHERLEILLETFVYRLQACLHCFRPRDPTPSFADRSDRPPVDFSCASA